MSVDPQYPIEPSKLPSTWVMTMLGEVVDDLHPGFASGVHNDKGIGTPHLRPMNIDRLGRITLNELRYVQPTSDLRVMCGDVLFNNTNSPELVGKTAPIDLDGDWAFSNHMTRLRPPLGVSNRFLAYQLHYLWEQGYFRLRCTQHVNQASISVRTLARTIPVILAPVQEQLRIVAELDYNFDRFDTATTVLLKALRKLEEYRCNVLRRAASGVLVPTEAQVAQAERREYESGEELLVRLLDETRERWEAAECARMETTGVLPNSDWRKTKYHMPRKPDDSTLPSLPDGWTWAGVEQVGQVTLGRQRAPRYHHGPHMRRYLRVANVFEDRIDASDVYEMNFSPEEYTVYSLQRGDILLNEGQSPELVGRAAMFNDEVPGACFQNTLIRFRAYPGVSPSFALLVFRHYLHSGRFQQLAKWSTNIAHLGADRFAGMEFPLPSLSEQERIVTEAQRCLSGADDLTNMVQRILNRITWARHAALEQGFTGKLVAQAEDDEPAALLLARITHKREETDMPQTSHHRALRATRSPQRKPLIDALAMESAGLTPEQLLQESGISEDLIDEFYAELKREDLARRIKQEPDGDHTRLMLAEAGAA